MIIEVALGMFIGGCALMLLAEYAKHRPSADEIRDRRELFWSGLSEFGYELVRPLAWPWWGFAAAMVIIWLVQ
jgi:hypothetical protein